MFSRWDEKRKRARSSQFLSHWVIYATKALGSLVTPTTKPRSRVAGRQKRRSPEPEASALPASGDARRAGSCCPRSAAPSPPALAPREREVILVFWTPSSPCPSAPRLCPTLRSLSGRDGDRRAGASSPRPPELAPRPEPLDFLGAVLGKGAGLVALPCPSAADSQEVTERDGFTVFN